MDDAKSQGFGYPPDQVTEPCLTYMARIMELRDFVSFFFRFVKTSEALSKLVPKSERKGDPEAALELLEYNFSDHRQIVNEIMLSRAVESFDLYLTTALRDIFISRPELLKSEAQVDAATIIEAGSYEVLIWQMVERRVRELSYKSLSDFRKFVLSRTGLDLFPSDDAFHTVLFASEIRNLIAHNDSIVNDVFKAKTRGLEYPVKVSGTGRIIIDDEWLRKASYTLDGVVFRFDEASGKKFDLRLLNRMTSFIVRS